MSDPRKNNVASACIAVLMDTDRLPWLKLAKAAHALDVDPGHPWRLRDTAGTGPVNQDTQTGG